MTGNLPVLMRQLLNLCQRIMDSRDGCIPAVFRTDHFVGLIDIVPLHQCFKKEE